MKNKRWLLFVGIAVAVVINSVIIGVIIYKNTHVLMGGVYYPRSAESLDLRDAGLTGEQCYALREELPDCEITWEAPFEGAFYPEDTTEITVASLTAEGVAQLDYLPRLTVVHAEDCEDYALLALLRERRPECSVIYTVALGGEDYPCDATSLILEAPDYQMLYERLEYLPLLTGAHIVNPGVSAAAMQALADRYPEVVITWSVLFAGREFAMDCAQADLSDAAVDSTEAVEAAFACLPSLELLDMSGCGVDNETMAAYRERVRDDYKVVWTVECGVVNVRTDETTFMPARQGVIYMWNEDVYNLRYCEDMVCVDLGHMRITNVEWAAYMPHLKYLVLAHSWVKEVSPLSNCKELVFLEISDTTISDYQPLLGCTALEDLNIGKTRGEWRIIAQMTWLKNLWWIGLQGSGCTKLPEALPNTHTWFYGERTVDGGWRRLQNYYDMRDMLGVFYMN